jgi:hypothetical protein
MIEYSCIPDVSHPWDPEVVRAIWKFAPDLVPMWERRVMLPTGAMDDRSAVITGRHAIGRIIRNQQRWLPPLRVSMPSFPCMGLTFERPNDLVFVHEDVLEEGQSHDLPGPYLPFDETIVAKCMDFALGCTMSEKEFAEDEDRRLNAALEAAVQRTKDLQADFEARERDFQPWAAKQLEKISDLEMKEFLQGTGKRERPRKVMVGTTPTRKE